MTRHKGDTLVEVIIAFAIFTLSAVITMTVLNQGVAIARRSLEKSLVRQQIDSQAEILRYIKTSDQNLWQKIVAESNLAVTPMALSQDRCPTSQTLDSTKSFFVATNHSSGRLELAQISSSSLNYNEALTHARIDYSDSPAKAYGVWTQVVKAENRGGAGSPDAYDFYIHACWSGVGSNVPMTNGTIVRLYD